MALALAYAAIASALLSALLALGADKFPALLKIVSFTLLGVAGSSAVAGGAWSLLSGTIQTAQLGLGLPWLAWHLRLDPLSGFFMAVTGIVTLAVAFYGPAYVREYQHGPQPLSVLGLFTGLFIAGMLLVLLANDAFMFMVAWELMSLSSYFLVAYQHQHAANRRAAYLYLLMAQVGALAILLAFGVLAAFGGAFTFDAMRHAALPPVWASIAFTLALLGFGMKAGLVPLHAWLPEAHPVAPSHISALMSGVMLKIAVYGLIRVSYDLVGQIQWGWGLALLLMGTASALLGVLYALMQHDLKRLLAYHSVENIGIIFMGLGLSMIFIGTGHPVLGVLGLIAALYHTLNHALFKSLLFLGAGAILQRSHEGDLEHMGGLIRRMPQTAFLFLIGCISISGLPPFNGFVSEWLTFQAALQMPALSSGVLRSIIPVTAALLALTGALAAACFVKVYGVAFLGQARTRRVRHAREVTLGMRFAMGMLALLCLLFGILPTTTLGALESIPHLLLNQGLPSASVHGWLWLTPVSPQVASYSAPLVLLGLLLALGISYLLLHPRRRAAAIRRSAPWDCGFGALNARMQYTSTAFSMPIRRVFRPAWNIDEHVEVTQDKVQPLRVTAIRHQLHVGDRAWPVLYEPIGRWVLAAARRVSRIQTGRIRTYLAYSFFTLLLLLWLIR
ncbi:MAG: hydrogenase 4 subunit B [Gammaproteobacteria bacterium]|nr:hydrogenase 4 subunit B [Gammaproteobacteria bacterium]